MPADILESPGHAVQPTPPNLPSIEEAEAEEAQGSSVEGVPL